MSKYLTFTRDRRHSVQPVLLFRWAFLFTADFFLIGSSRSIWGWAGWPPSAIFLFDASKWAMLRDTSCLKKLPFKNKNKSAMLAHTTYPTLTNRYWSGSRIRILSSMRGALRTRRMFGKKGKLGFDVLRIYVHANSFNRPRVTSLT